MSTHRQTRINAVALAISVVLGLGALAGCTGSGSGSSAPTTTAPGDKAAPSTGSSSGARPRATPGAGSAPALLSGALAALRSGGSVHVDITSSIRGNTVVYSDEATASGGRQIMTLDNAARATILFIAKVGYVQADAVGLSGFFGVPQSLAQQFAGKWIALRPGDKLGASTYDDITGGITLSSVASELELTAPRLAAPATVAGQRVVGVHGSPPASDQFPATARGVLYVTDNSLLRPVLSEVTDASSDSDKVSFSHWGETVHLTAPANAIPASDVTQGSTIA